MFYCDRNGSGGIGKYTNEGFVVQKGAIVSSTPTNNFLDKCCYVQLRETLIKNKIIQEKKGKLIFCEDYLFKSPSAASAVLIGTTSNGWQDWKTKEGKTLDSVQRGDIKETDAEKYC